MNLTQTLQNYDLSKLTIGVLGGHSALDVCAGAKKLGFKTLVVAQKGREQTYEQYYKTRGDQGCVDGVLVVEKFADIVKPEVQETLRAENTIFIHNRYFWVYCNFDEIENDFNVPIYGTRHLVRLEERDHPKNQYWLLEQAGIRTPRFFKVEEIDRPVIVKVNEAARTYERAFFIALSPEDFRTKSEQMIAAGTITREALEKAVIEEFVIGAQINLNYFYSVQRQQLEFMGTDTRRQTSLDGFLRLDAKTQESLLTSGYRPSMVETGHIAVTAKESLLEKFLNLGERFVKTTQEHAAPGIIGPFALQGAVVSENGKEDIVIFDVSMRIPGSPGTRSTPYTRYLWGEDMSYGDRIALEIQEAVKSGKLEKILT